MSVVEVNVAEVEPPPWLDNLTSFCRRLLTRLGLEHWEVSILLCGDNYIEFLNKKYRGLLGATDVLSFSQIENTPMASASYPAGELVPAGDVVISLETAYRNADAQNVPGEEELKRLVVHGVLHLTGMDHESEEDEIQMMELQESLCEEFAEEALF
jgi:probable rRNA maturation factor